MLNTFEETFEVTEMRTFNLKNTSHFFVLGAEAGGGGSLLNYGMYAAARTCMFPWYMHVVSEMLSLVVLRSAICVTHSNCHHQVTTEWYYMQRKNAFYAAISVKITRVGVRKHEVWKQLPTACALLMSALTCFLLSPPPQPSHSLPYLPMEYT